MHSFLKLPSPLNMKTITQDQERAIIYFLSPKRTFVSRNSEDSEDTLYYTTVHNVAKRSGIERPRNKGGRPRKLSEVVKRNIVRNIASGKCDTATEATKMLQESMNINVNAETVRNA